MKLLIVLAIIGFVVCLTTKEELLKRALQLEARLEADIAKVHLTHQNEAAILKAEETQLKVLSNILRAANNQAVVNNLETQLSTLERKVEETLQRIESTTRTPTTRPTTSALINPTTKVISTDLRDLLVKRSAELISAVNIEIENLKQQNRVTQSLPLQKLMEEVKVISTRINNYSETDILRLLDSELDGIEIRLHIEMEKIEAQAQRLKALTSIATALKQRIEPIIKSIGNTPVGQALEAENKKLDTLLASLKTVNEDNAVYNLELELALTEKRVNDELSFIDVHTIKS
jgi:hypothetical protein